MEMNSERGGGGGGRHGGGIWAENMKLALDVTRKLKVPATVFINKDGLPGPDVAGFCEARGVPVVGRLPLDRGIAETYSRGELVSSSAKYREVFTGLREVLLKEVGTRRKS